MDDNKDFPRDEIIKSLNRVREQYDEVFEVLAEGDDSWKCQSVPKKNGVMTFESENKM